MTYLLDTNAVSAWLEVPRYRSTGKDVPVEMARVHARVADLDVVAFSVVTAWEIDRGLLRGGSKRRRDQFHALLSKVLVVPADPSVWDVASEVWAASAKAGALPGDMDALIVATAKVWGYTVVTHDAGVARCAAAQSPAVDVVDWAREP